MPNILCLLGISIVLLYWSLTKYGNKHVKLTLFSLYKSESQVNDPLKRATEPTVRYCKCLSDNLLCIRIISHIKDSVASV